MKFGLYDVYSYWVYLPWEYIIEAEMFNICIHILLHFEENLSRTYYDVASKKKKKIDKKFYRVCLHIPLFRQRAGCC